MSQELPKAPICERWENGNLRLIQCNYHSLHGGAYYAFHTDGSPMLYAITDSLGNVLGDSYTFWEGGAIKTVVKRKRTEEGLASEAYLFNKNGVLNKLERFLDDRQHGEQYYFVEGKGSATEYYYKGVRGVNPKYVENPSLITKDLITKEENAEVRRVYLDIIGTENFLNFFDYEVLDIDINKNDILYQINEGEVKINMVKFICPSTADVYFHFIPFDIETVGRAKCWMFGIDGDKFEPVAEA